MPKTPRFFLRGKEIIQTRSRRVLNFIDRFPFWSLGIVFLIFLALIVLGNFIRKPRETAVKKQPPVKSVHIYSIGTAPKLKVQAQVEKSGVVQISALMGGVVTSLPFKEGDHVKKGTVIANLSSNYNGANASSVQRQIAQTQFNNIEESYPIQRDLIGKQREAANKTDENSDELRKITADSIDETKSLISLNNDILGALDKNIQQYESTNSNGSNDALILSTKQMKSQFVSANNQLNAALRNAQYQSADDKPPAQLSDIQKDITMKQLDLQEKSLDLNREVTRLQLQLSRINESLMYPSVPFSGIIQRVLVKVGQSINPGDPILILSQDVEEDPIVAIAYVTREVAQRVSTLEPSTLYLGSTTYSIQPSYITRDAIKGSLYGIYFPIPDNYHRFVTDNGTITVEVPIGYSDTSAVIPYLPIDAVYQSAQDSYVYVVGKKNKVEPRTVTLGEVYGSYVQLIDGLKSGDQVILDRNVIVGDNIQVQSLK